MRAFLLSAYFSLVSMAPSKIRRVERDWGDVSAGDRHKLDYAIDAHRAEDPWLNNAVLDGSLVEVAVCVVDCCGLVRAFVVAGD